MRELARHPPPDRDLGLHILLDFVRATRGKQLRAEPVAGLYEQGLVNHCGPFPKLEDQMCEWTPQSGQKSPDRLDWLVWAIYDLVTTMAIQSQTPEVSLKVLRDLVTAIVGESATSEIVMEFMRHLTTTLAAVSATGTPNLAVLRDLLTAIAIESQTSEVGFMFVGYVPEHLRVRVLLSQLEAELSAPVLRVDLALRQLKGE